MEMYIHSFLTPPLGAAEWPASRLGFLPPGTIIQHSVTGRLGGPRSQSGRFGEETNLLSLPVFEPRSIGRPARSPVTVLNTLSRTVPFSALLLAAYNNNRFVTVG